MKAKVLFNTVAAVILLLVLCGCREEKNCSGNFPDVLQYDTAGERRNHFCGSASEDHR